MRVSVRHVGKLRDTELGADGRDLRQTAGVGGKERLDHFDAPLARKLGRQVGHGRGVFGLGSNAQDFFVFGFLCEGGRGGDVELTDGPAFGCLFARTATAAFGSSSGDSRVRFLLGAVNVDVRFCAVGVVPVSRPV